MRPPSHLMRGFTIAELLLALALTALLMTAVAFAMHSAEQSSTYNQTKSELVTRVRGVLDRMARDIHGADATIVATDGSAVNIRVVRAQPGGDTETLWRQYRLVGTEIKVYEDTQAIPLPPSEPDAGVPCETLTGDVAAFQIETLVQSSRSITETLSCRVTTCSPAPAGSEVIPLEEGPYVLKLSQTQFDTLRAAGQLHEGVDVTPRPSYEADDDPNVYWLCLEDCQAPNTYYEPWADWDFEDVLVKVTETAGNVLMEVQAGQGGYQWDILGPDGDVLWENLSGNQSYSYVPYCLDADTVQIRLELERDHVRSGGTITATQRKALF